ncbi:MAG TPA: sugar-binding protein [Chthonomonadaceae bacterium]|nr:sugar-binding protein [Chthonomonadaceae bacterium]
MQWRSARALWVVLALLLGAGASAAARQPQPRQPGKSAAPAAALRSLLYGVNVVWGDNGGNAGWDRNGEARARRLMALMKAAGVTNTRIGIGWADVERVRGKYDWRGTDKLLHFLKGQGFVLTCVVDVIPDWANDPDPAVRKLFADRGVANLMGVMAPAPPFYADFGRFAYQLGRRYKDIVHRWELWNEPDGMGMPWVVRDASGKPVDIRYGGDPAVYARLLRIFAANIKRADPTCLVAVGGLATARTDFLQALYANGGRGAFDAVCLHPYNGPRPIAFDWIDACRQVLLAHGDGRKKFWLTEWGWSTYPGEPGGIVEGQQARLLRASFAGMRERPFIEQASYHTLNDWRTQESDPLSLVSMGLCTRDLTPKPSYAAFQAEARGLPLAQGKSSRIALVAGWPEEANAAVHLDIYSGGVTGALPRIGRGLAPETSSKSHLSAQEDLALRLKSSGAALVRVAPFRAPDTLTAAPDGTPVVRWAAADAALLAVAQAGGESILELTPPRSLSPSAWSAFVTQAVRRYGTEAKYRVARWEFGGAAADARRWYGSFAQAVRAALPTTPVGFCLMEGDPVVGARALAELCAGGTTPCDSFAWRTTGGATQEAQTLRRIRAILAGYPALKSVTLWPTLDIGAGGALDFAATAQFVALAARMADFAPANQPNALGGVLAASEAAPLWNALTLTNRVAGARLRAESDEGGVRCLASRATDGTITALVWREDGAEAGELRTALRLHGLPRRAPGGWRMEQFLVDATHSSGTTAVGSEQSAGADEGALERVALADLPGAAAQGDIELPLVLMPDAVTLITLKPRRPTPVQVSLSVLSGVHLSGDSLELLVTLRNTTHAVQRADVQLVGSLPGLVPPRLFKTSVAPLAPGVIKAVRYRLRVPAVWQDTYAFLNALVGGESRGALAVKLETPLAATLETSRVDLNGPGGKATVRVRLVNRAPGWMPLTLRTSGSRTADRFEAPGGGKPVVRDVEVSAPASDPGNYPVTIGIEGREGLLARLRVTVGVPVLCRYAALSPRIDGDLREWADADPIGMGRPDQAHGKEWRGPADVSAYAYAKWDEKYFYLACAVTDDVPFQPYPAAELWRGDSVQFALSADRSAPSDRVGYGPGDHEFGLALLNGTQPILYRFAGPPRTAPGPVARGVVVARRLGTRTYYEAAIPWSELAPATPQPGTVLGFSIVVNDNDGQERGYMEWGGGIAGAKRPGLFPPLRLVR